MGMCLSCSRTPGSSSAAPYPSSFLSSHAIPAYRSRCVRKSQMLERSKAREGGGGGGGSYRVSVDAPDDYEVSENELHRLPCRLFLNGASEVACLYCQQGKKGTNQDAMVVWENFASRSDTIFCGVFDGHGPLGHMVSKKVRDSLPLKLSTQWRANLIAASIKIDEGLSDSFDVDEDDTGPEMYLPLKMSVLKAFKVVDKDLKFDPIIDCFCSGTTAVTLVKQGQDLVIGNLGDSRAVMGTRDKEKNLIAVQLTVDLKPDVPREAARIEQCKGRVFALKDEPEVPRVWLPNSDAPGLAMARAFGDFCLKDYGLISIPDISYRHLIDEDEFIILATDGVWDVLSNQEAVDIVASAPTRGTAARALVDCAVGSWRLKFPTSKIDDCAAVCLFLDKPSSAEQPQKVDSNKTPIQPAEPIDGLADKEAICKQKSNHSVADGAQTHSSPLQCSSTSSDTDKIVPISKEPEVPRVPERSTSTKKNLTECMSVTEDDEWSALLGVTRANSIVNLPRLSG